MYEIQTLFGQLAALLAVVQVIPYIRSILKGETKPSRTSYGIWLLVEFVLAASYIASGATTTKWIFIIIFINSIVVFLLSLKYGMKGFHKLDGVALVSALVAIALWVTTDNPYFAVYMSTLAIVIGYIPTEVKTYSFPKTENKLSWSIYVVAAFLNICALTTLEPTLALPPILSFVMATLVYLLLQKNFNKSLHHYMVMRMHTTVPIAIRK